MAAVIYHRAAGVYEKEQVYRSAAMQFLYHTTLGGVCRLGLRLPVVSRVYGLMQRSPRSRKKIRPMIERYGMQLSAPPESFSSFQAFVTRNEAREIHPEPGILISPADGCLLVREIRGDLLFSLKGRAYTLSRFLRDTALAKEYDGGLCLLFRLRVYDYHRFCFMDSGTVCSHKRISGFLDSVNWNETGRFTLSSNAREITRLDTASFGEMIVSEVGALLVGEITQNFHVSRAGREAGHTPALEVVQGQEKGVFGFGGSSIVVLLKQGCVQMDEDLLEQSKRGIETWVRYGERIGKQYNLKQK